jgi:hypothetical protein
LRKQVQAVLRGDVSVCSARRLFTLADALPDDSALARGDSWSMTTELVAFSIERADAWFRSIFEAAVRRDKIEIPGPLELLRPPEARKRVREEAKLEAEKERAKREGESRNDPARIAAFFGGMGA